MKSATTKINRNTPAITFLKLANVRHWYRRQ